MFPAIIFYTASEKTTIKNWKGPSRDLRCILLVENELGCIILLLRYEHQIKFLIPSANVIANLLYTHSRYIYLK